MRMTYEELNSVRDNDPEEFERVTLGSKRDFVFGIWRLRHLIIVLDRKFLVPLGPKAEGFPFVLRVDERYGSRSIVDEDDRVTFYLPGDQLRRIVQDAKRIEAEYTHEGMTIERLPDIWFEDTHLVRFLRERVVAHPLYREWDRRIRHTIVGT